MQFHLFGCIEAVTRQIVTIAPGVITPASLATMVEQIVDISYNLWDRKVTELKELDPKLVEVHYESGINNAAAEIAFSSFKVTKVEPAPGDDSRQTMITTFETKEVARNIAACVASFCPEIVTDEAAADLVVNIVEDGWYGACSKSKLILLSLKKSLQQLNKTGSAYTVEDLLLLSQSELDSFIDVFNRDVAGAAKRIAFHLSGEYAEAGLSELLKKREKTWEAPTPVYTTVPKKFVAPPSYSSSVRKQNGPLTLRAL